MRRYWLDSKLDSQNTLRISGDAFHHIFDVCRNHIDSEFEVLGVKPGHALQVQVIELHKKHAVVKLISERLVAKPTGPNIVLNLSIPKISTLEAIVEKSVELGVERIQLFCSQHSFIRKPEDFSATKMVRLNKIILHATQQSGRADLMSVCPPTTWDGNLKEFINHASHPVGLLAYESLGLKQSLKIQMTQISLPSQDEIWVFIGSEGGFSSTEVEQALSKGLEIVSLGSQVLRVETACVVLVGSLKYELGLM